MSQELPQHLGREAPFYAEVRVGVSAGMDRISQGPGGQLPRRTWGPRSRPCLQPLGSLGHKGWGPAGLLEGRGGRPAEVSKQELARVRARPACHIWAGVRWVLRAPAPPPVSTGLAHLLALIPVPHFLCHLMPFNKRDGTTFSSRGPGSLPSVGGAPCSRLQRAQRGPRTLEPCLCLTAERSPQAREPV